MKSKNNQSKVTTGKGIGKSTMSGTVKGPKSYGKKPIKIGGKKS